ncbi:MAG: PAS domain S-box protein [Leptolyngbyaceae cyanobacterium bins.59]|nr:PAS domain S-box protein [Leptolyngbyaceae cyanobacterium bins.59]
MSDSVKILVVDDTPANLEVVTETLSFAGYSTSTAISGERALKRLQTYIPDLILLDVQMPGMDGFETCQQLKANPVTAHIPVIFMTALGDIDSKVKGLSLGAVDYITKPLQEAELLARVNTHLQLSSLTKQLERRVEERTAELQLTLDHLSRSLLERKASELALRESENKFRALLSNLDGAVYRCQNDAAWTMEFMSDFITTLTGYPVSDFINSKRRTYASLIHPDDTEMVERIVGERVTQHQSFTMEYRIIHREGWVRWVRENGKGIFDEQNQLRFLEGVIVDISDRKLAEENSRLLSSVVESSQDAIITKNLNSIITSWNQAATDLFGYTENEAIGQSILMLFPDDCIREESLIIASLKQNKRIDSHETVRLHQDGTPIDCAVTISPLLSEEGKVIGASSIFRDIRDRKRLESEQQRLLDVLEATPDYIGIANANGKILWHNKHLRELRQDLVSHKSISECHPAWVNEIILNQVFPVLTEKGSWSGELALLDSNGKEIPVSQVIVAHKSKSGEIQYVSTIMRDISDRKAYEERLEKNNAEIIRATRMKDEFLATMSHELRTPMNAILGMTEALQDEIFGAINEKQFKALATVESSGNHLLELINDILDVSKIESGQIELDYQNTAIIPLCQQSLEFIKPQAAKKSIQVVSQLPINLPDFNLDERRIRQVLINLLNNAVKFTPEAGCITLEVIYPATIKQQNYLQINIKDTGIGIAPENLEKVFEPFIQVDSALNRNYEGTGLGLALVKRIVELHRGEVTLTSELGVGSCFAMVLPL